MHDLRFALRALRRSAGFTAAAIATLALGIGTTVLVFSLVDALLLRPLPFGDRTERLVTIHSTHPTQARQWDDSEISYADLVDLRRRARSFESVEGYASRNFSLMESDATERVLGASVTPGLFELLGIRPQLGRDFHDDEGAEPGFETVALISHDLWQRSFGGDAGIVGEPIRLNDRQLTIVGVMPPRFGFPEREELWVPYAGTAEARRNARFLTGVGLLSGGVTVRQARSEIAAIAADLARVHPDTNRDWGMHALPMREFFVGGATRRAGGAMLGAVALVLLVACANVAGLVLARGLGRERELTVRAALGAGRWRLVRLVLVESAVVAAAGGALGLALAAGGLRLLLATIPEAPPFWAEFAVGGRAAGFALLASVVATLLAGVIPALRISRVELAAPLQGGRGAGAGIRQRRAQTILVAGQLAVAMILLIAAALLSESAWRLQTADAGFDPENLLSARFYIAGDEYDEPRARAQTIDRIVARVVALPGVRAAAATGAIPADDGGDPVRLSLPGAAVEEVIGGHGVPVSAELWQALGVTLRDGRTFAADEIVDPASDVVIVNERLARMLWPDGSAVGRQLVVDGDLRRVIGIAPDLVFEELGEENDQSRLQVWFPYAAEPWRSMALLVRSDGDAASLTTAVRQELREVDPSFALFDAMTMTERRRFTHWTESFLGGLFAAFGFGAVFLACIGAYGLAAYAAAQRTREIGIRFALGATPRAVLALLLRRGALVAIAGLLLGLPAAAAAARVLESLLFGVSPWNAAVWLAMPLGLFAVVVLATWLPSRRAAIADPASALRHE